MLTYSTVSISHPIQLSAANSFPRLKLSVCNPSYLPPMVSSMYVDSLKLKTDGTELPASDASKLSLFVAQTMLGCNVLVVAMFIWVCGRQ